MVPGSEFRLFSDLYLDQRPGNVGNEFLEPENAWSYEANFQYKKRGFRFKAGYFYRSITDFIEWVRADPATPYSPVNFGKNKVHGIYAWVQQEFNLGKQQAIGYSASYNYMSPSFEASDDIQSKYTLESLKHQFIAGVHYRKNRFSFQPKNRLLQREIADAYNITDFRINYQLQKITFYTEATNLFDAEYKEAGAVSMPSRWFVLGAKFRWSE